MRPEGPLQWLRRCPKATGGIYKKKLAHILIPDRRHLQQPTGYHAILVGRKTLGGVRRCKAATKRPGLRGADTAVNKTRQGLQAPGQGQQIVGLSKLT